MTLEKVKNFLGFLSHKITGCSYITHENGYPTYHCSKEEIARQNARAESIENRKQQILRFQLEDMYQYGSLPFDWNKDLFYSRDKAFLPLTRQNKEVFLWYVNEISMLIEDVRNQVVGLHHPRILTKDIDFEYPIPFSAGDAPNSYLECIPYTQTGRTPKYPVVLHFRSSQASGTKDYRWQFHPYIGEIKILCDGSIGAANVTFAENYYKYSIRLFGTSLVVRRIDSVEGNIYMFGDND